MPARSHRIRKLCWSVSGFTAVSVRVVKNGASGRRALSSRRIPSQGLTQLRSEGDQARLAELRVADGQHGCRCKSTSARVRSTASRKRKPAPYSSRISVCIVAGSRQDLR